MIKNGILLLLFSFSLFSQAIVYQQKCLSDLIQKDTVNLIIQEIESAKSINDYQALEYVVRYYQASFQPLYKTIFDLKTSQGVDYKQLVSAVAKSNNYFQQVLTSIDAKLKPSKYKHAFKNKKASFFFQTIRDDLKTLAVSLFERQLDHQIHNFIISKLKSSLNSVRGHIFEIIDFYDYRKSAIKFDYMLNEIFPKDVADKILEDTGIDVSKMEFDVLGPDREVIEVKNFNFEYDVDSRRSEALFERYMNLLALNDYLEREFPMHSLKFTIAFHFRGATQKLIDKYKEYGIRIISNRLTLRTLDRFKNKRSY